VLAVHAKDPTGKVGAASVIKMGVIGTPSPPGLTFSNEVWAVEHEYRGEHQIGELWFTQEQAKIRKRHRELVTKQFVQGLPEGMAYRCGCGDRICNPGKVCPECKKTVTLVHDTPEQPKPEPIREVWGTLGPDGFVLQVFHTKEAAEKYVAERDGKQSWTVEQLIIHGTPPKVEPVTEVWVSLLNPDEEKRTVRVGTSPNWARGGVPESTQKMFGPLPIYGAPKQGEHQDDLDTPPREEEVCADCVHKPNCVTYKRGEGAIYGGTECRDYKPPADNMVPSVQRGVIPLAQQRGDALESAKRASWEMSTMMPSYHEGEPEDFFRSGVLDCLTAVCKSLDRLDKETK
jgi:hypothetical protein